MGTIVDLRNVDTFSPQGGEHGLVDPLQLSLGNQIPSRRVLVGHDHKTPTSFLEESHSGDGAREELEMFGRADVSRSAAIDHAVTVKEYGRLLDALHIFGQAVTLHPKSAS